MAGYQRYPEYKESGVEWLGGVPRHWDVSKVKLHFDIQLGKMLQPEPRGIDDEEVTYLKAGHVQWEKIDLHELPTMWASPKEREKFRVVSGDLLVCEGGEVGRSALLASLEQECIIQNALHRVRPLDHTCTKYLNYLMRHLADADWFSILCNKATIAHLTGDKLGALVFPMPTLEEQQTIARFLDHKTAQIDALIAKKQTLLEKLAEKRTALISHAVTKGLDPNAKMKDSGVEWLEQVPAHWDCPPLYCRYTVQLGKMLNEARITGDYLYPYLRNIDVQWDLINYEDLPYIDIKPDEHSRYLVSDGDLLVCEGGDIGRAAIVEIDDQKIGYQKALHRLRAASSQEVSRYMFYTLFWASKIGLFVADGNPNTIPHLTGERFRRYRFPCPPREEQLQIVRHLEDQNSKLDAQSQKAIIAIEKLKEYRSALITQAVTGKIDVRNVKIPEATAKGQAA